MRHRIAEYSRQASPVNGEIEVDESYFDPQRIRGTRSKTIVFGLFKRNVKVYTEIVPNCKAATLQTIIRGSR